MQYRDAMRIIEKAAVACNGCHECSIFCGQMANDQPLCVGQAAAMYTEDMLAPTEGVTLQESIAETTTLWPEFMRLASHCKDCYTLAICKVTCDQGIQFKETCMAIYSLVKSELEAYAEMSI